MNSIKAGLIALVIAAVVFAAVAIVASCTLGSADKGDGSGSAQPVPTTQPFATAVAQPQ